MSHDHDVHGGGDRQCLPDEKVGHQHMHERGSGHDQARASQHSHGDYHHVDGGGAAEHAHGPSRSGFRAGDPPPGWRADREPGFGKGKIVYFDALSGLAGDMTVAALVDLGVPQAVVEGAVASIGLDGCLLQFRHGFAGSIGALKFDVDVGPDQKERDFRTIDQLLQRASLEERVRSTARCIFRRLAEAEAAVHRTSVDAVHFHEVGAIDSIADIVGAAACVEYIGAAIWTSPLPMGRGFVQCRHGTIPLPAPATIHCLAGIVTKDAGIEAELVTPTGAAIIATVAKRCVDWPTLIPIAVGWGAGSQTFSDRPNVLRVVLGDFADGGETVDISGHVVIEANVDDATGELAGHALGLLLEEGALDAWAVPITMKKGRPGVVLSAIVGPRDESRLTALLIRETTTLGVRRHVAGRTVRPRRMIEVETRYGSIPVKVSEGPFGPPQVKPEFDYCAQLARQFDLPVREVLACAIDAARRNLGIGDSTEKG